MILKRLTATGFKSFADRTEFDFGPGITCIVGPNGCGKSNVVDAIKWVLGEQSARSLRGKHMMDVIFNGSGTRKSMGMAQVDLTFDNSDRLLPIDMDEVIVSRRLYRSGESEYLLNKQVCRLKDVRELFLDTGIGVDAYSVIEQGRVDVLLQANPVDRRTILEEAAGISKYKVRKKEAQRRLERVNQNLLRLADIIGEVEKRLRSVKLAAGRARNYQAYFQRLRELRSTHALAEYHRLRISRQELDGEVSEYSDLATRHRTELSDIEARISEANVAVVGLERDLSACDGRLLALQAEKAAQEERIAAARKRRDDQADLLARSRQRLAGFDEQAAASARREEELTQLAAQIDADFAAVQDELAAAQETDRRLAAELRQSRARLEDEKAGIIDLLRRTSQLRNELAALALQQESLTGQKARLEERDQALAGELASTSALLEQLRSRQAEIERLTSDQASKLEATKLEIEELRGRHAALSDQHSAAKELRSALESRRQVLADLDRAHVGLLAGVQDVLQRRDADATGRTFAYVRGAVGELFEVDAAHAALVEAVLDDLERYLVVTRRDALLADRAELARLSGPARAFCLDALEPVIAGPDLSGQPGVVARLLDWVRFPDDCAVLARVLLDRTYVVESLDDARRLSALDPAGARFVTLDGVVWDRGGRVAVRPLGSGGGVITRRSELRELSREVAEAEGRIGRLADELQQSESRIGHLLKVEQRLRAAIADAQAQRAELRAQVSSLEDSIRQLGDERPLIAREVAVLLERIGEMQARQASGRSTLSELDGRSSDSERAVQELQAQAESLVAERERLAEKLTLLRVRGGELAERRAAVAEQRRELEQAQQALRGQRAQARREVEQTQELIDRLAAQAEEAKTRLVDLSRESDELTARSRALREQRDGLRASVDEWGARTRLVRAELERTEALLHERQMKLQEVRVRTEDLVARISEELSVDIEAQYAGYLPDQQQDWPAVEAEINDLRQKIERLGNVNLDAIDEQAQLEERQAFLSSQYDDLKTSERQLLDLIERLNNESTQRFQETFDKVAGHFAALFKKLFGGGKADLILMDPSDVLECGIEITARPPGKEPQSISLLSGGEKTMTAIALLLAVFKSRPSPFVLLDEVDAALDEANNVRFNHVVQEFVQDSQFIIITHSKRTMSIADVMYGVTMQEAGVSKRVSVRFEEEARQQPAVA